MRALVKICGLRDPANLRAVAALTPDFIGLIFYEHSPRFVGSDFSLSADVATGKRVGVFVNAPWKQIEKMRNLHNLSWIQLHGNESVSDVRAGHTCGWQIIKAFSVDANFDFAETERYAPFCRYFLFDTKGGQPGGNGYAFDWRLLKNYRGRVPFLLSGGLGAESIGAVRNFKHEMLAGFDVNSGVEVLPGMKSIEKVKFVIQQIHHKI